MEILQKTTALFNEYEIGAYVLPIIQGKTEENPINLSANGALALSPRESKMVTGFRLGVATPKDAPIIVLHRNLAHAPERRYHSHALLTVTKEGWTISEADMRVYRRDWKDGRGVITWTVWQAVAPNRADCWFLTPEGLCKLFQVGIIARGYGEDLHFRVLGELRGEWQLSHNPQGKVVGIPTNPLWGAFDIRRPILDEPRFQALLEKVLLPTWAGSEGEMNPSLKLPSEPNRAVMEWWSAFTGLQGQGPIAPKGSNTWVCGEDVEAEPDPDGILRLPRGTIVSYEGSAPLGDGGDRKLLKVRRAS